MSASSSDKLRKASGSTRPVVTTLALPKENGATTAELTSASGWNTSTGIDVVIYRRQLNTTTGNYEKVAGTQTDWTAALTGTTLSGMVLQAGTEPASGYAADGNTVVFCGPTAQWSDDLIETLLLILNQDGTFKNNVITSAAQVTDAILGDAEMATAVKPVTLFNENTFDHVVSGCVWTADAAGSTRLASCTAGVVMLSGKRLTVAAVTSRTFTASKDVYDDLSDNGDGTAIHNYTDGTTNAASGALTAGRLRNAIVVVGASNIATAASINQGQEDRVLPIASSVPYTVTDSLGNLICPRDPNRKVLGYRQITTSFSTSSTTAAQVTGLTCPIIIPTGRKIKITAFTSELANSTTLYCHWGVVDGVVGVGTTVLDSRNWSATATRGVAVTPTAVLTPSATSKTYNVFANVEGGASTLTATAASTTPAFILIELV